LSPAVVIRRRHPPPVIRRLLSWHNFPPNLGPCCIPHPPLSWHCPPPYHLTRYIVRRPPSAQRYRRHSHSCDPLLTPATLIAPSTSYCLLLSRCPPAAAIVTATFSLLRPVSSHLPPPALVTPTHRQCDNISPAAVAVTSRCSHCEMLKLMSMMVLTAFALRRRPLAKRGSPFCSYIAPDARRHHCRCCCRLHGPCHYCCHPYHCRANTAR
jgi:hypothetical protein